MSQKTFKLLLIFILTLFATVTYAEEPLVHVVQRGENLYRIALRYGITRAEIAEANEITAEWLIYEGQELVIPGLETPTDGEDVVNPLIAGTPTTHVIQHGESLQKIANQYGVTVDQIMLSNSIGNPDRIYAGQEIKIWTSESVNEAVETLVEEELTNEATVVGETTLDEMVDTEEEVVEETTSDETVDTEEVAEETTSTETATTDEEEAENATTETEDEEPFVHTVRAGETLASIAQRYGIDWVSVAAANGITNPDRVYAGTDLIIPNASESGLTNNTAGAYLGYGREIVVDVSDSTIYAYEDGELVHSVLASLGTAATPTVQGSFNVYTKYDAQTMSGPGYYLPDVPWVMYFYGGYAIHGTYWHENWGTPMSHGCVNLPPEEAKWFYEFASIGTSVHVQY